MPDPDPKPTAFDTDLAEIEAISKNARSIWFSLLGLLLFFGVTIMGVTDADFYSANRATTLPLIGVDVPTRLFFAVAPVLTVAVYAYFHLYQLRLWRALGEAASVQDGRRLGRAAFPWLLSDAALYLRWRAGRDGDNDVVDPGELSGVSTLVSFALSWGFGVVVLAAAFWVSLPARSLPILTVNAAALTVGLWIGSKTYLEMRALLQTGTPPFGIWLFRGHLAGEGFLCLIAFSILIGFGTARSNTGVIDLRQLGAQDLPEHWAPYPVARSKMKFEICGRDGDPECSALEEKNFGEEFKLSRRLTLQRLVPAISVKNPPLRNANLAGAALVASQLDGADFSGADLSLTNLEGASIANSNLEGVDFTQANLTSAQLADVTLRGARFEEAVLTRLEASRTSFKGSVFVRSRFPMGLFEAGSGNTFRHGLVVGYDKSATSVRLGLTEETNGLVPAAPAYEFDGLYLTQESVEGLPIVLLDSFRMPAVNSTAFRFVVFENPSLHLDEMFADGGSLLVDDLSQGRTLANEALVRPCHWPEEILGDKEFFARWRGWRESRGAMAWPPSEVIGDLPVALPFRMSGGDKDGQLFTITERVKDVSAEPLPVCSKEVGRPCLGHNPNLTSSNIGHAPAEDVCTNPPL